MGNVPNIDFSRVTAGPRAGQNRTSIELAVDAAFRVAKCLLIAKRKGVVVVSFSWGDPAERGAANVCLVACDELRALVRSRYFREGPFGSDAGGAYRTWVKYEHAVKLWWKDYEGETV